VTTRRGCCCVVAERVLAGTGNMTWDDRDAMAWALTIGAKVLALRSPTGPRQAAPSALGCAYPNADPHTPCTTVITG
jgi:hypothetical protein